MQKKIAYEVKNLKKVYEINSVKQYALNGVDLKIYDGEFVVILGQSGAGKSTFLNVLSGITTASEGDVYFYGDNITNYSQTELTKYRGENIGFIFQSYNLFPSLTAKENIQIMNKIKKSTFDPVTVAELVGMENHLDKIPSKLSGGEQQRIAIARALYKQPKILFCDEATGALDSTTGAQILSVIKDFNKKFNTTVVFVTHNRLISKIADKVVEIKDGKIIKTYENESIRNVEDIQW